MIRDSQHVVYHPDGGWGVKKGGAPYVTRRLNTQKEAIAYGRQLSRKQRSVLYIHRKDGLVREKNSYRAEDPISPRDP